MSIVVNSEESQEVQKFLNSFYDAYYRERNLEKISRMVADNVVSVGLSDSEIGRNRKDFEAIVGRQLKDVPNAVQYFIGETVYTDFGSHIWNCFAKIGLRVVAGDWGIIRYVVRITITLMKTEAQWKICCIHCSESTDAYAKKSPFSFKTDLQGLPQEKTPLSQHQIGDVMNYLVPGGVISRLAISGYPIAIANKQFLKMMGYAEFKDFIRDCENSYLNQIHLDDVEKFMYIARFIYNTGKQCECDYRLRRKNGSYLWVHDVSRRAISAEGKEILVSVITDMSERTERLQKMEMENGIDFLTKVYNRRGMVDRIKKLDDKYQRCFLCIIDLDFFKNVNDLYSHITGDRILEYAAKLLSEQFGNEGIVARIGGDEFAVFLPDFEKIERVKDNLLQVSAEYKAYVHENCPDSCSSFSIGGIYGSRKLQLTEKYEKADANLYHVKNNNKGNILLTCFD